MTPLADPVARLRELADCPFCGGPVSFVSNRDWHRIEGGHEPGCPLSDYELAYPATDECRRIAIAAWNRRASSIEGQADSERLDYIERTFSGMTNRERYLPVQMVWGNGAMGRSLREACDKYMKRDAARTAAQEDRT